MKTVEEMRELTKSGIEKEKERSMHDIYMRHEAYIEKEMIRRAKLGFYNCYSSRLNTAFMECDYDGDLEELRNYLIRKIKVFFGDAWNYKVEYSQENDCMIISWGE